MSIATARQEWAAMWPLPFVAMLGVAGSATFAYSSGVFMGAMTHEFGWSRSQFSSAFAVQMILGLFVLPLVGRLVDRIGPRRIALCGIFAYILAFSALGFANGTAWQWWALGGLQVLGVAMISPPIWISAVVPRFHASRGMALAVALAGVGVASAVWPILAALGVEYLGWRATFGALALGWSVIMLPLAWIFLVDPPAPEARIAPTLAASPAATTLSYGAALRSSDFVLITLAGGIFASISYGLTLHLVPVLHDSGLTLAAAAGLAGLAGIFSIIGRLGTGFLLDHLSTRPLAILIFLLPIIALLLLRQGGGSWFSAAAAVAILGLSSGAETDIVVYTLARRFERALFASIYAAVSALFALFASMGPLLASVLFDRNGNYDLYLIVAMPVVAVSALLIGIVLSPRAERAASRALYTDKEGLT